MNCLAYLITFRTYGSWLPGDERGFVDHARQGHGATQRDAHTGLERAMTSQRRHDSPVLDRQSRGAIEGAIGEACDFRGWTLHAMCVRSNHVHLVVSATEAPEKVMSALKMRATKILRTQGFFPENVTLWARHGSTKYLWDSAAVAAACRYIIDGQGNDILA